MIEGTYVKNGEVTEVFLPNGLTQLIVEEPKEIQAFTFKPKVIRKKRSIWIVIKDILILASLMFPIVPVSALFLGIGIPSIWQVLCVIGGVWDALVIFANNPLR